MVKDVVSSLDYSICAEISLAIFITVFIAVSIRTMFSKKSQMQEYAKIALEEGKKESLS